jgi:hypothetical protein
MKVLWSKEYFGRDLFVLEIEGKVTQVYRSSGMNGGRKGSIIPFWELFDRPPRFNEVLRGIRPGWISKEFLYGESVVNHYKELFVFGESVERMLLEMEDYLKEVSVPVSEELINQDILLDTEGMILLCQDINEEMKTAKNGMEEMDWKELDRRFSVWC